MDFSFDKIKGVLNRYRGTLIGILFISIGMFFYLIMQTFDLWTSGGAGPTGFCEYFNPDLLVGEPMNAWSNFYYIGAGMLVLAYYDLTRSGKFTRTDGYYSKKENLHYMVTYGLIVIWLGLGSFYMHGGQSGNELISGWFFDVLSMNMFASALSIFSFSILFNMKKRTFYILLVIDFIAVVILMKSNLKLPSLGGGGLFELFIGISLINEILISIGIYSKIFKNIGARQVRRNIFLVVIIVIMFLLAFWIWHFGLLSSSICDPYSLWQWHAVWHFITACVTLVMGCYMLTEREIK